jgi:multidrug efflux pump subunit AcrB
MSEVSRPIIAITLVLSAVFIPVAFVPGLTGQFYKQFALTIASPTIISAFNSLTLSPALAAVLLKPHGAKPDALTRGMDKVFGRFFAWFNRLFQKSGDAYQRGVTRDREARADRHRDLRGSRRAHRVRLLPHAGGLHPAAGQVVPGGVVQLPPAASLDRTAEVVKRMGEIAKQQPGVASSVQFAGVSANGFAAQSSAALVFFPLKDFDERKGLRPAPLPARSTRSSRPSRTRTSRCSRRRRSSASACWAASSSTSRPPEPRRRSAVRRRAGRTRQGLAGPVAGRRVLQLPDQRSTTGRRRRSPQGQSARA